MISCIHVLWILRARRAVPLRMTIDSLLSGLPRRFAARNDRIEENEGGER